MHARKMVRKGFTLVEILIVVVILGILAAIVIPQFTNASTAAKASSVTSQLQTLRSQVELYKNQHNNAYPTSDGTATGDWDWTLLTSKTTIDGAKTGSATELIYGPYVQQPSKNPFTVDKTAFGTAAAADGSVAWILESTGVIKAAVPSEIVTEQNMDSTNDVTGY